MIKKTIFKLIVTSVLTIALVSPFNTVIEKGDIDQLENKSVGINTINTNVDDEDAYAG